MKFQKNKNFFNNSTVGIYIYIYIHIKYWIGRKQKSIRNIVQKKVENNIILIF